ncbi:MAG: dipeptidase [Thermodesulfobacteriota bacterium]
MINDLFIVDAHEDIAFHLSFFKRDFVNPTIPCMITLPWLKRGNIRLLFNTIFVHPEFKPNKTRKVASKQFEIYERLFDEHKDSIMKIQYAEDLQELQNNSKIGFLTLMEGAEPIEKPDKLNEFYDKGVRIIGLAWNDQNQYASGANSSSGLTGEGRELVKRMNDLRITLDLSHLNENGFWEALEICDTIPIATHSNARAVTNHPRNLNDDQLRTIAERGGVIGLVLYNNFLRKGNRTATLEDVFSHADYIVNLCGEDHIGIGSDLDGGKINEFPEDIRTVADLPKIADFFLKKGYSVERIRKIMGGNFLRVIKENLS